jgi:predicted phage terminase large subunit-like protein
MYRNEPITFFADTAYTEKTENDPSGIITTCKIGNDLYIINAKKFRLKFPDLIKAIPPYVYANGYKPSSTIRIEPKANGLSVIDQLKVDTKLNITKTQTPTDSKETRLNAASPIVECGRVYLVIGAWNEEFTDEICGFPAKAHDEYVDLLGYAIDYHLKRRNPVNTSRLAKQAH